MHGTENKYQSNSCKSLAASWTDRKSIILMRACINNVVIHEVCLVVAFTIVRSSKKSFRKIVSMSNLC